MSGGRLPALFAVVAFGLLVALRAPFFGLPLERDEGEYAYVAQRAMAGEIPYRDAFDQKPPLIFAAYAAAFALFGERIAGIRLLACLWSAGTGALLFWVGRRVAGDLAGAAAALLFAVAISSPDVLGNTANTELFLLLPATASFGFTLRALESRRARDWAAASALAAAAAWFKQVAAVQLLLVAGAAAVQVARAERPWTASGRAALALVAGAAGVSLPILLFFAATGSWASFVDAVVLHNLDYASTVSLGAGLDRLGDALAQQAPGFWPLWALAAAGLALPGGPTPARRALLAAWLALSFLGLSLGLNYRPHYFIQWLAPLCALGGVAVARALETLGHRRPRLLPLGATLVLALILLPPLAASRAVLAASTNEERARLLYGRNPFPESLEIAARIRADSDPDDRVFVMGSEPQILFYAQRASATRYILTYPLRGAFPDALARQKEALAQVEAAAPRYVVWVRLNASHLVAPGAPDYLLKQVRKLLERDYELEGLWVPEVAGFGYRALLGEEARGYAEAHRAELRRRVTIELQRRRDPDAQPSVPTSDLAGRGVGAGRS